MSLAIGRISRWLLCALLWCGIAANCCAQIQDSPRWLVLRTEHRILDQFHDNFGWPDPEIPKGQAVVYVYAEGASYKLLAVGPVTSDAKAYARILNEWKERHGLSGPVLYSQENDCAAALFSVSETGFGKTSTNLKLPLASIITEIKLETKTNLGLVINGNLKWPAELPPPGYLSKRIYGFWDLSKWSQPKDLVIQQKLEPWLLIYFVSVLLFPFVATGACYAFAVRFAQDESRSLEQRRRVYRQLVLGGTIGPTVLHSLLFVPAVAFRSFDPITYLWFDAPFLNIGLYFGFALLIVPVLFAVLTKRTEASLSALTEAESRLVQLSTLSKTKVNQPNPQQVLQQFLPMFCLIILGVCILYLPTGKRDPLDAWKLPASMLIIILSSFSVNLKQTKLAESQADDIENLRAKAEFVISNLNHHLTKPVKTVTILESNALDQSCSIKGQALQIAEGTLRLWNEDQLLYYFLHKSWFRPKNPLSNPFFFLLFAAPFAIFALPSSVLLTSRNVYLAFLIPIVGIFISSAKFKRTSIEATFATDLRVVQATGNPESAVSALERMDKALQVGLDAGVNKPKPSYTERIERIRAAFPGSTADERTISH